MALLLMFLIFSTTGFPKFGDINSIANQTLSEYYMNATKEMMEIPNVVTAILASFRGFDTMGEVIVIFIAGISVYLILGKDEETN
jgi:multicomponent Na+:H+ antiporter subunit B